MPSKTAPRPPKTAPRGAKMPPIRPQEAPKGTQEHPKGSQKGTQEHSNGNKCLEGLTNVARFPFLLGKVYLGALFRSFFVCFLLFVFGGVLGGQKGRLGSQNGTPKRPKSGQNRSKTVSCRFILQKITMLTGTYVFQ